MKPLPSEDLEHVLTHTAPLWEAARGHRLFVTGGTGFFGTWLLESFAFCNRKLHLNAQMTVLTRDPRALLTKLPHIGEEPSIKPLQGDVRSFDFPEGQFDYVIHAAAPTSAEAASQPMALMRTILHGTERVIGFANGCGARRFLLTSSGAVYGRQPAAMSHVCEDYIGSPRWLESEAVYAEGKRVSEQMCSIAAKDCDTLFSIARCFAFVGPHLPLDQHFAIGNFIGDALAGRPIAIAGDGTPRRSYLYAADLAVWLWTMLFRAPGRVPINVGSGRDVSIRELAEVVAKTLAPGTKIEVAKQAMQGAGPARYVPSVKRAEELLGLRETVGLEEAIRRTAVWYRAQ